MTIRIKNLNQFNREIKAFGDVKVPKDHLKLQKKIALDLLRRLVFRTPVKTGRARGNWQTELGPGGADDLDVFDKPGGATISRGAATMATAQPFGIISLFNNVNYIKFLEGGSSIQAPMGMVKVSLAEVEAQFS